MRNAFYSFGMLILAACSSSASPADGGEGPIDGAPSDGGQVDRGIDQAPDAPTGDEGTAAPFHFPVYGAGRDTIGGRGGALAIVTTLEDSMEGTYDEATNTFEGSFRYCLTREVPRNIVFRVSGTIELDSPIFLDNDSDRNDWHNFTVWGQSAPEGGITIRGHIWINNVNQQIWRYVRIRHEIAGDDGMDSLTLNGSSDVVVDHCSLSYGADEALSVTSSGGRAADRITFQYNLLIQNKTGSIIGSNTGDDNPRNTHVTFYRNAFIDTSHRFPNVLGSGFYEVINNFVYNWQARLTRVVENPRLNHINNYYKPARLGLRSEGWFGAEGDLRTFAHKVSYSERFTPEIYTAGNLIVPNNLDVDGDNRRFWTVFFNNDGPLPENDPVPERLFVDAPHPLLDSTTEILSAQDFYEAFIEGKRVGADRTVGSAGEAHSFRDGVDEDFLDSAIMDTGGFTAANRLFDRDAFVYPEIPQNAPIVDEDRDGLGDDWERERGLSVGARDTNGFDLNAEFTNLEVFLNLPE